MDLHPIGRPFNQYEPRRSTWPGKIDYLMATWWMATLVLFKRNCRIRVLRPDSYMNALKEPAFITVTGHMTPLAWEIRRFTLLLYLHPILNSCLRLDRGQRNENRA